MHGSFFFLDALPRNHQSIKHHTRLWSFSLNCAECHMFNIPYSLKMENSKASSRNISSKEYKKTDCMEVYGKMGKTLSWTVYVPVSWWEQPKHCLSWNPSCPIGTFHRLCHLSCSSLPTAAGWCESLFATHLHLLLSCRFHPRCPLWRVLLGVLLLLVPPPSFPICAYETSGGENNHCTQQCLMEVVVLQGFLNLEFWF